MDYNKRRIIGVVLLLVGMGGIIGGILAGMHGNVGLTIKSIFGAVVVWGIAIRVLLGMTWWEWNKGDADK